MRYDLYFWDKTEPNILNSSLTSALMALAGVIISVVLTHVLNKINSKRNDKFKKEINDDNLEFQKMISTERNDFERKLKNDEIDANLKARARIEWIQEVRKMTAKLIALCYRLHNDFTPKNKLIDLVSNYSEVENDIPQSAQDLEAKETLIKSLSDAFPDMSHQDVEKMYDATYNVIKGNYDYSNLHFEGIRQSLKNKGISKDVSVLVKPRAKKYYSNELFKEKRDQLISEIKEACCLLILYFGPNPQNDIITNIVNKIDVYVGDVMISEGTDVNLDEDFIREVNNLSNEMRTYLKREWDRAKNNQD